MEQAPSAKKEYNQESQPEVVSVEFISRLQAKANQAIEMEADIKTVISVFSGVMKALGLQEVEISGGGGNIQAVLPAIIGKLSREMMMGTFNTQALADIQAVMPIIDKYKHFADER